MPFTRKRITKLVRFFQNGNGRLRAKSAGGSHLVCGNLVAVLGQRGGRKKKLCAGRPENLGEMNHLSYASSGIPGFGLHTL